jgi:PAS domain S-box-containing protein
MTAQRGAAGRQVSGATPVALAGEIGAAVRHGDAPMILVDPARQHIREVSDAVATLLGADHEALVGRPVGSIIERAHLTESVVFLLRRRIDAFWTRRKLLRADGSSLTADIFVRAVGTRANRLILCVLVPSGRLDDAVLEDSPESTEQVQVVGTVDDRWRIDSISPEVTSLLGYSTQRLLGTSLLALLYPPDAAALLAALAGAGGDAHSSIRTRVRAADGSWRSLGVKVSRLEHNDGIRLAFTLCAGHSSLSGPAGSRVAELERRLWCISQEIHAAGILRSQPAMSPPKDLPQLSTLSAREWEVLTELLAGRRCPGIAQWLFISPSTVRNHLASIYRKLGVRSQSELIELLR